jgi:hypothetical protein
MAERGQNVSHVALSGSASLALCFSQQIRRRVRLSDVILILSNHSVDGLPEHSHYTPRERLNYPLVVRRALALAWLCLARLVLKAAKQAKILNHFSTISPWPSGSFVPIVEVEGCRAFQPSSRSFDSATSSGQRPSPTTPIGLVMHQQLRQPPLEAPARRQVQKGGKRLTEESARFSHHTLEHQQGKSG